MMLQDNSRASWNDAVVPYSEPRDAESNRLDAAEVTTRG